MATATERVPVLMTPTEKEQVVAKAKQHGVTIGEYMRRAAAGYQAVEDEQALSAMIDEMNKATASAERSIDHALKAIAQSNKRIAKMEVDAKRDAA